MTERPERSERPGRPQRPERERTISDVETLKALSDHLRLKILERMVTRVDEPWTVKELAEALGVSPTRLYHHIDLLVERDLVRPAAQRVVSGIIETSYRVAALSLRLDQKLLATEQADAVTGTSKLLGAVFDAARRDLEKALRSAAHAPDHDSIPDRPLATHRLAKLTPAQAGEFRKRLEALLAELDDEDARHGSSEPDDTEPYGLVVAMYHLPDRRRTRR
jgi:DNA-binding transcriptional ArsR family regulator